jgi:hypothetical protein
VDRPGARRLAEQFFLIAHDEGLPRLSALILGRALGAALLAELALLDAIRIAEDRLRLKSFPTQTTYPYLIEVIGLIRAEEPLPVRDWLDYLGRTARERIGTQLAAQGLLERRVPAVRFPRRADRWIPTDSVKAAWPAVEVQLAIGNGTDDPYNLTLFGLIAATGLSHPSLYTLRALLQDPPSLARRLAPLAEHPPVLDLLAHAQAAVTSAVASRRHI